VAKAAARRSRRHQRRNGQPGRQKTRAANPSFEAGCDDDPILRYKAIENETTDDGKRTTNQPVAHQVDVACDAVSDEVAATRARFERTKAERFALWKAHKFRTMREAETRSERPPP
jgi:hypothetical protein